MKKFLVLILLVSLVICGCSNKKDKEKDNDLFSGKYYVEIVFKDYGKVIVELDADEAPITVTNFLKLVNSKFYDGLKIHRVVKDFLIQGGANFNNSAQTIKGEFSANGINNNIKHTRGTISMARRDDNYDSASAQFFIMIEDSPSLDGYYAAFGHVIKGMDVVDKIGKLESMPETNGILEDKNQPIIERIVEIDSSTIGD